MKTSAERILLLVKVGVPLPRAVDLTLGEGQYEKLAETVWREYLQDRVTASMRPAARTL
jgi:hypothetical protein